MFFKRQKCIVVAKILQSVRANGQITATTLGGGDLEKFYASGEKSGGDQKGSYIHENYLMISLPSSLPPWEGANFSHTYTVVNRGEEMHSYTLYILKNEEGKKNPLF